MNFSFLETSGKNTNKICQRKSFINGNPNKQS